MLNGDVLTDIDLTAQIAQHEAAGATATLALAPVEDPSDYGLVRLDRTTPVREFVEKPSADQIDTNTISAGAYVLERRVLDLLAPDQPASIERDVFPRLVGNGLYGHVVARLLARHRDARALPAGHVRHPRGRRSHTEVQERLGDGYLSIADDVENAGRDHPVGARRARLPDRRRRAHRRPRRARARRLASASETHRRARRRPPGRRDRRALRAARLHRRRRRADRRPLRTSRASR